MDVTLMVSLLVVVLGLYIFSKSYVLYQKTKRASELWLYFSLMGISFTFSEIIEKVEFSNELLVLSLSSLFISSIFFAISLKKYYTSPVDEELKILGETLPKVNRSDFGRALAPCGVDCEQCEENKVGRCLGCEIESTIREEKCPIVVCSGRMGKSCSECEYRYTCDIYSNTIKERPYRQFSRLIRGVPTLIRENKPDKSLKIFEKLISHGLRGIYVTRELHTKENLENVYIVIFSEPDLKRVYENISSFLDKNSVILLTDFDYIIESNSFHEIRDFLIELLNLIITTDSYLIIPLGNELIDKIGEIISDMYTIYIIQGISNPIRKNILEFLKKRGKTNFSDILRHFDIKSAPNLSFHLRELKKNRLIAQDEENLYYITQQGDEVLCLINELREGILKSMELG
ncbi:MAG: hypothetical protein DRN88_04080 [Candidatus Hydrothermarchaeota archaeon]|nr:MAG: hypothetical protein DRN88_04080 [Candidatus Hydrothermarchaeota archaeon]